MFRHSGVPFTGGCCRQPQVPVLLPLLVWVGTAGLGLSRREAAVPEKVCPCIFAHLDAHLCSCAHSQSVWESFLGSLWSTASTGLLSAGRGSSTAALFFPLLEFLNSLLVFLRKLGFGVLLSNTFGLIFCTVLGSCPQEYSLGWAFLGCKCQRNEPSCVVSRKTTLLKRLLREGGCVV